MNKFIKFFIKNEKGLTEVVKLYEGCNIEIKESAPHEEGWSSYSEYFVVDRGLLYLQTCSDGVDCDGRHTYTTSFEPVKVKYGGKAKWYRFKEEKTEVYDQYARMANY